MPQLPGYMNPIYEMPDEFFDGESERIKKEREMRKLEELMEEMANAPREEMGKRQPGERGSYEKFLSAKFEV